MKVVAKFAVAFFVASMACFVAFTYVLAEREADRLERTFSAGMAAYGNGLRLAVESSWREQGDGAAQRIVEAFAAQGEIRAKLEPAPVGAHDRVTVIENGAESRTLRLLFRVEGPEGRLAMLVLERDMMTGQAIIRDELEDQIVAAGSLAIATAALAVILGAIVIGRPLGRVVSQARRIGQGDLSQRLRATRKDEIGDLKREINLMCDRLVESQARIEEETTARIETLEKLRHLDRLRTVGTIASSVAHELGTPLNILLLRGQSLAAGVEVAPTDIRDAGSAVVSQVEKMIRIVRQLLDFARARGAAPGDRRELELADVARHAAALLTSMAKKHGVTLLVEDRGRVRVAGDFGQLEQALTNLIVNGIQAMPDGGTLRVSVGPDTERGASIEVSDEGPGVPAEVRERMFEPFFTTKPEAVGTGLGLHVARGIVEDHGGSIDVRSELGRGATFVVRVPASR